MQPREAHNADYTAGRTSQSTNNLQRYEVKPAQNRQRGPLASESTCVALQDTSPCAAIVLSTSLLLLCSPDLCPACPLSSSNSFPASR
jgi:hypothetical protein